MRKESRRGLRTLALIAIGFFLMILISLPAFSQPTPHTVQGRVFNTDHAGNGAHNGLWVLLNETIASTLTRVQTNAPPLPQFLGSYSTSINGIDGSLLIGWAWNSTHYGTANTSVLSSTTTLDIHLNHTRGSEGNVTILLPLNNSIVNTTDPFNVTANITIFVTNGTNCNATISFNDERLLNITSDQNLTNQLGNITISSIFSSNHTTSTWNVSGRRDGLGNVSVGVQCASDVVPLDSKKGDTHALTIIDTTPPEVFLTFPLNLSWTLRNITFLYNVTENTGLANCSLVLDGRLNQTANGVSPSTPLTFTLNETPEHLHNWSVSCTDNGSNYLEGNSSFRLFTADGTPPTITLLLPRNGSAMENYTLVLRYNVTDNFNATNCSLILNNALVRTNHTIALNQSHNFTEIRSGGDYNWSVNCSDNSRNIGASGTFSLFSADLALNPSDIISNRPNPSSNERVQINATIFNLGLANHTRNATVLFREYDTFFGTSIALLNYSVNLTSGANTTLLLNYTARVGTYSIVVEVDIPLLPNGSVVESREDNNIANITFFIPPYHTFYGEVLPSIILDTFSNKTVFQWMNSSSSGNVYVADTDSSLTFSSLIPLGRNASNNITFDDFSELDLALNTTNLSDSINRSYTSDGWANYTSNFTLFSRFVTDVPIANSTNSSNFVTGILWDSSDSINGNYSGSEDVVFLTRMNLNQPGRYGTYDYEISIPANLERYAPPDLDDSISFYRELQ